MLTTMLPFLDGWSPINTVKTVTINKGNYDAITFEHKGALLFTKFTATSGDTRIYSEGLAIEVDETPTTLANSGQTRPEYPIHLPVQTSPYVIVMGSTGYTKNSKIVMSLPAYSADALTTVTYELHGFEVYDEESFLQSLKELTPTIPATPVSTLEKDTVQEIPAQIQPKPTDKDLINILNELKNANIQTLEYLKKITAVRW